MARRARQIAINLTIALISTIVTVALLEFGARHLQVRAALFIYPSRHNCMQRDAQLSLTWLESCAGSMSNTTFRTNAVGLRGTELRDDGSVRILAIGDSCTWGWGVDDLDTYPAVLQELLNRRFGSDRYQVLNAGMPGYTSHQGLLYLRERGWELKPSIVLAGFGFNDATLDGEIAKRIASERLSMPFLRMDDFLLYESHFWRWARSQWHVEHEKELVPRVGLTHFSENLNAILDLAQQNQGAAMLIDFLGPGGLSDSYSKAMNDVGSKRDVPVLVYKGARVDIVHPSRDGYRKLAEHVFDRLLDAGYDDSTSRRQRVDDDRHLAGDGALEEDQPLVLRLGGALGAEVPLTGTAR